MMVAGEQASVSYRRKLIPQPDPYTCWAACTAMLTGKSLQQVISDTPPHLLAFNGDIKNESDGNYLPATTEFAAAHGLKFHHPMSWSADGMFSILQEGGPVMVDMLWNTEGYTGSTGSPGHMVLIIGMDMGGKADGSEAELTIVDPGPPRQGSKSRVSYFEWYQTCLTRTYRLFQLQQKEQTLPGKL